MTEATVVNLFFVFRVFLVGAMLVILPRILRKGLLFGAYVGEEVADGEAAREVRRSWVRGCAGIMVLALAIGLTISAAGWPVTGNLTGTVVLLLSALVLYLRTHSRSRKLAPPDADRQALRATASLGPRHRSGEGFAKLSLGICLIASAAAAVFSAMAYVAMPEQVPGLIGTADLQDKSIVGVMFAPSLNLLLSPFLALMALLTAGAKRSVRGGSGGGSAEAQDAFRFTLANALSWAALLTCGFFVFLSVQMARVGLSAIDSPGAGVLLAAVVVTALLFANLIRIVKAYGQGGAFRESGSVDAPLTGSLADNSLWVWGLFYFDRNDPSMMVEKRFGFGYAVNYGNRSVVLIVVTWVVLALGLAAMAVIGLVD